MSKMSAEEENVLLKKTILFLKQDESRYLAIIKKQKKEIEELEAIIVRLQEEARVF